MSDNPVDEIEGTPVEAVEKTDGYNADVVEDRGDEGGETNTNGEPVVEPVQNVYRGPAIPDHVVDDLSEGRHPLFVPEGADRPVLQDVLSNPVDGQAVHPLARQGWSQVGAANMPYHDMTAIPEEERQGQQPDDQRAIPYSDNQRVPLWEADVDKTHTVPSFQHEGETNKAGGTTVGDYPFTPQTQDDALGREDTSEQDDEQD